jgi:hypothetical protein
VSGKINIFEKSVHIDISYDFIDSVNSAQVIILQYSSIMASDQRWACLNVRCLSQNRHRPQLNIQSHVSCERCSVNRPTKPQYWHETAEGIWRPISIKDSKGNDIDIPIFMFFRQWKLQYQWGIIVTKLLKLSYSSVHAAVITEYSHHGYQLSTPQKSSSVVGISPDNLAGSPSWEPIIDVEGDHVWHQVEDSIIAKDPTLWSGYQEEETPSKNMPEQSNDQVMTGQLSHSSEDEGVFVLAEQKRIDDANTSYWEDHSQDSDGEVRSIARSRSPLRIQ